MKFISLYEILEYVTKNNITLSTLDRKFLLNIEDGLGYNENEIVTIDNFINWHNSSLNESTITKSLLTQQMKKRDLSNLLYGSQIALPGMENIKIDPVVDRHRITICQNGPVGNLLRYPLRYAHNRQPRNRSEPFFLIRQAFGSGIEKEGRVHVINMQKRAGTAFLLPLPAIRRHIVGAFACIEPAIMQSDHSRDIFSGKVLEQHSQMNIVGMQISQMHHIRLILFQLPDQPPGSRC